MEHLSLVRRTNDSRTLGLLAVACCVAVAAIAVYWASSPSRSDMDLALEVEQQNRKGHESAEAVTATASGYAVAGHTNSRTPGVVQAWALSFEGNASPPRLDRTYHAGLGAIARAVATTGDGGLLLAGETEVKRDRFQPWILALTSTGEARWERTLGRAGFNGLTSIAALADGSLIAGGSQDGVGWLVRLSTMGETLSEQRLSQLENITALVPLPSRGFAVAGVTATSTTGLGTSLVLTFDENQQLAWTWKLDPKRRGELKGLAVTPDGGLVATGRTSTPAEGSSGLWVVLLDSKGSLRWEVLPEDTTEEAGHAVTTFPDGSIAVAGDSLKALGNRDARVWRFAPDGHLSWRNSYGGDNQDLARGIARLSNGELVVVGATMSSGAGKTDLWVLRLSERGEVLRQQTFGGP